MKHTSFQPIVHGSGFVNGWPIDRQQIFLGIASLITCLLFYSCRKDNYGNYNEPQSISGISADAAVKWADMTLYTFQYSRFNTPTYSSRSLGYLGLAMYESIVPGDPDHRSLNGQLNGLSLPFHESGKAYQWILSLNAAEDTLLKLLYPVAGNSSIIVHERIDSLANAIYEEQSKHIDPEIVNRSVAFGISVALAIYNWSRSDGGHEGYKRNFDSSFVFPKGESYWIPPRWGQSPSKYPLHPFWGQNRTFVTANSMLPVPAIVPFSTDTSSAYFKLYKAVYDKDHVLTLEEKEIAAWWGDDPKESFSPPGHSYYLASLAIIERNAGLLKAAEAYARTGMAVADAFRNCWKAKYTYFNERPSSYVNKYIDDTWVQFWPEPPFPAFPSGHSIQAGAAAAVLTDLFGEPFSFTDRCHEGFHREDNPRFLDLTYHARTFSSIWEAANECVYSRFLGGIHTQQDNEVGLQEGKKIGENVNVLQWKK